jgi:hypothetical protein
MMVRLALAMLLFAALPSAAETIELQPYRAVYDLSLASAKSGSGITALDGLLVIEWAEACDGYKLDQRMGFRLTRADRGDMMSDIQVETLESKDGTQFRFSVRSSVDHKVVDEMVGTASLDGPGKGGSATFKKPRGKTLELPPGTIFPTEHTRVLVERALAGERRIARTVFEGSNVDTPYQAVAFLGPGSDREAEEGVHDLLAGRQSWSARVAYFPLAGRDGVPEYEVGFRMFSNGISDRLLLDYGDFVVSGALTRLEALAGSGC